MTGKLSLKKRMGVIALCLMLLLSGLPVGQTVAHAEKTTETQGAILHAFCWNFNTIKENMKDIAEAGYTSVQTSPINECLNTKPELAILGTNGAWYYHYQPTDWVIGNYQLGSRDEFIQMCAEAEKYGVDVIVDIVPNHTTPTKSKVSQGLIDAAGGLDKLYHEANSGISNYGDRFQCTRYDMGGLPDVDTENIGFQNYFYEFLEDCIACGADGFRIDTAKHIGLPDDDRPEGVENSFYPNMKAYIDASDDGVDYSDLFVYGEVLQGSTERLDAYQDMLGGTTASKYGESIRSALVNNDFSASKVADYKISGTATADRLVTWVESHDTYYNDGESWEALNDDMVKLGWAIITARADGTPLFFNRPEGSSPTNRVGNNIIGVAGNDTWKDDEVVAVNKFKLAMDGTGEKLSNPDGNVSVLMIERGDAEAAKGAVIVNGLKSAYSLSCPTTLEDGVYENMTDDNSIFIVQDGIISGTLPAYSVVVLAEKSDATFTSMYFYNSKNWKTVKAAVNGSNELLDATAGSDGWWNVLVPSKDFTITFTDGTDCSDEFTVSEGSGRYATAESNVLYTSKKAAEEALGIKRVSVYFLNSELWDTVNAYAWIGDNQLLGGWPGVEISYDGDYWYRADLVLNEDTDFSIIFNDGTSQTSDITIDDEENIYVTVNGNKYKTKQEAEDAVQFSSRYTWIYFYNDGGWDEIAAYTWGGEHSFGGWPGNSQDMIDDGDGWYKIRLEDGASAALYVIFNNNGGGQQTPNINISDAKNVYIAGKGGKKYPSKEAAEKALGVSKSETTVYFYDKNNWDTVYAYAYIDGSSPVEQPLGGWPGTAMTADANHWYKIDIPAGASDNLKVIFTDNNGNQTGDYTINDITKRYVTSDSTVDKYSSKIAAEEAIGVEKSVTVVHFYNNDQWETVSAYLYGGTLGEAFGGWPGKPAVDDGNGWWSIEVPGLVDTQFNIIFNNGGNGKQTADFKAKTQEDVWCYMGAAELMGSKAEVEAVLGIQPTDSETPETPETPVKVDIAMCEISLDVNEYTYDGTEKKPEVTVKYNGTALSKDKDYVVGYKNNVNIGEATAVVTGINDYTGQTTLSFMIVKADEEVNQKQDQTIVVKDVVNKKYGNKSFNLNASAQTALSYESSNSEVAVVDDAGKVTIKGVGIAVITIKAEESEEYNAAEATVKIIVKKGQQKITTKVNSKTYKKSGLKKSKYFRIGAKASGKLSYKLTKGSKKYVTVSKSGKVTVKKNAKKGVYKIAITAKATSKYEKATKVIKVIVK